MKFDVIVIGAGAAGLASARDLSAGGRRVCIVEARTRIGGRVLTERVADLPLPLELGAEFIHGASASTFPIVDAAALLTYELPDEHRWSDDSEWSRIADFREQLDRLRSQIPEGRDRSFAEFIRTRRSLDARHRQLARPLQSTLFFAGEATSGDETGTVSGAITSGRRAARELLGATPRR